MVEGSRRLAGGGSTRTAAPTARKRPATPQSPPDAPRASVTPSPAARPGACQGPALRAGRAAARSVLDPRRGGWP